MSKNECAKTVDIEHAYETWQDNFGFEWKVLKKYQTPENEAKNEFARWYCAVKSPFTHGSYEYGDVYVNEIKKDAVRVS